MLASVIGATGYTGLEVVRLLINHPQIELQHLISSSNSGCKLNNLHPHLEKIIENKLVNKNKTDIAEESGIVFICLPHLESQKIVPELKSKTIIIDLGGNFRIKDKKIFKQFYKQKHSKPKLLSKFVYGLPELNNEKIKNSSTVANPGCFATAAILSLLPIAHQIKQVSLEGITGSSGSGKTPSLATHHPIRNNNVKSYKIDQHQHLPEIKQATGIPISKINFAPTSGPFTRGIHMTAFVDCSSEIEFKSIYKKYYQNHFFVRIKDRVMLAEVVGSNFADIAVTPVDTGVIVQTVIDNLMKGAAGTAIQNMNLMFDFNKQAGLKYSLPIYP